MKTKMIGLVLALMLVSVVCVSIGVNAGTPTLTISPDIELEKGEAETVSGYYFPANESYSIDLLLPDGTVAMGVSTGITNLTGYFQTVFVCPDKNGDGYVRAVVGSVVVSVLCHFHGTQSKVGDLLVTIDPDDPTSGETSHITVLASFLETKNYVMDFTATNPNSQDEVYYYVLHHGKVEFNYTFKLAGYYWVNASVENTPYYYTNYIEVQSGSIIPPNAMNITWDITNSGNQYSIMLYRENYGYVQTGNVSVRSPDGKTTIVKITNNIATVTASTTGTYVLKYTYLGKQYASSFTYSMTITFISTHFSTTTAKTTLTLLVNGAYPNGDVQCNVTGAVEDTFTLTDGEAVFTATVVGDYVFKINWFGISKTTTQSYTDTYTITDFSASVQGNNIIVSGTVLGVKTQSAGDNLNIQISVMLEGDFKQTVTTESDGTFMLPVPIVDKGSAFGGMDVTVKASILSGNLLNPTTSSSKTASVHVSHDLVGEYGWIILFVIIILVLVLWKTGLLTRLFGGKIHPPQKLGLGGGGMAGQIDNDQRMGW